MNAPWILRLWFPAGLALYIAGLHAPVGHSSQRTLDKSSLTMKVMVRSRISKWRQVWILEWILFRASSSWLWPAAASLPRSRQLLRPSSTLSAPPLELQVLSLRDQWAKLHPKQDDWNINFARALLNDIWEPFHSPRWSHSGEQHPSHLPPHWQGSHHQRAPPGKID